MKITTELKNAAEQWWCAFNGWKRDTLNGQSDCHDGGSTSYLHDVEHKLLSVAGLAYSDFIKDRQRFLAAQEFIHQMEDSDVSLVDALAAGQSLIRRPLPSWMV